LHLEEGELNPKSSLWEEDMGEDRYLLQFKAATGFTVVLEFGGENSLKETGRRVEEAGLTWERLPDFNVQFDQADLFMDLRSPVCAAQFNLEDWL
jgi:hypothetical protein|tara:strand:- start:1028 stop:1312 length:285 start_codon:yes stop_codon:yes gene_type:complete